MTLPGGSAISHDSLATTPVPPAQRVSANWLAARAEADTAARTRTESTLLNRLTAHLEYTVKSGDRLDVIDVGAGTGANQRWLAPRLPYPQRWTHLDHDAEITSQPASTAAMPWATTIVTAGVEELPELLARPGSPVRILTCAALLDVLTEAQIVILCRAAAQAQIPALFSLTVTGELVMRPAHPLDRALTSAFNGHQQRGGRAGPRAAAIAEEALRAAGCTVWTEDTPWRLGADSDPAFVDQFLRERVDAAVEHDPALTERAATWLDLRRSELHAQELGLVVGHRDVLALPGR